MRTRFRILSVGCVCSIGLLAGCASPDAEPAVEPIAVEPGPVAVAEQAESELEKTVPEPQFTLTRDQTHARFSRDIPPVLTVPSGAVVPGITKRASECWFLKHGWFS